MIEHSDLFKKHGIEHGFLSKQAGISDVLCPKQIHGTRFVVAEDLAKSSPLLEADGIFSQSCEQKIGIVTADCLPILVSSQDASFGLALHAGWKGFFGGIIGEAFRLIHDLNIRRTELLVAVGPSISGPRYEVGEDLLQVLWGAPLKQPQIERQKSLYREQGKTFLDLKKMAFFELLHLGLKEAQIELSPTCTYNHTSWASYRRDGRTGERNLSFLKVGFADKKKKP